MKKVTFILLLACIAMGAEAATSITTATVSGHWTTSGSPYKIFNNITLNNGSSLIIDPGVEVVFQGSYDFNVTGQLIAVGTEAAPIRFRAEDTTGFYIATSTAGSWKGMMFGDNTTPSDSSAVTWCHFTDMKGSYGVMVVFRNLQLLHCEFSHILGTAVYAGMGTAASNPLTSTFEMGYCSLHDILGQMAIFYLSNGTQYVHDCKIYDNASPTDYLTRMGGGIATIFANNDVYNNTSHEGIVGSGANVFIKGNKIHHNTGIYRGAIYINGRADIDGNLICNNSHTSSACALVEGGGAIHVSSNGLAAVSAMDYKIRNNVIANNKSPFQGPAIKVYSAGSTISNNHIINNSGVAGPIYILVDTFKTIIKNNLFFGNETGVTGAGCVSGYSSAELVFENNWSESTSAAVYANVAGSMIAGDTTTNIIGTSPGMVAPTLSNSLAESALTNNFALVSTSDCIDHGNSANAMADTVDYMGHARIYGGTIDIGAFEFDPTTTLYNPQLGFTPHIDIFPNPSSGQLFMTLPQASGTIRIMDLTGRHITERAVSARLMSFDLSSIPSGIYMAIWNDGSGSQITQKIVVE